jgi:hypothetical protein
MNMDFKTRFDGQQQQIDANVKDTLVQSFESLENDNSITGYEITDNQEKPLVCVDKKEFEYNFEK